MSRPPATSRKLRRVLVLLALFLLCLPESKTSALNSVRGVPEQLQATSADGAGFAWSGGRALSKVGVVIYIYIYIYIYIHLYGMEGRRCASQSEVGSSGNLGTQLARCTQG